MKAAGLLDTLLNFFDLKVTGKWFLLSSLVGLVLGVKRAFKAGGSRQ